MELKYGYASFVRFEEKRLTIQLSSELFALGFWETIKAWFQTKYGVAH